MALTGTDRSSLSCEVPCVQWRRVALDPSERYAVGYSDASGASFMTVWKLDDPSTPHPVLSDGETGRSFWVEGSPL